MLDLLSWRRRFETIGQSAIKMLPNNPALKSILVVMTGVAAASGFVPPTAAVLDLTFLVC